MNRSAKILIGVVILAAVFYYYFLYVDFGAGCYIKILPSLTELNNITVKRAISVLKNGSPDDYKGLCRYVGTINPNISCGGFGGGCFFAYKNTARTIDISTANGSLIWTAGIIVHETCHARQFYEKKGLSEPECYAAMDDTLKRIVQI